jgi:spermidine/putrescine transport system ATP-binding protein
MTQTRAWASPEQVTETLPAIELAGIVKEFSSHGDVVQAVAGVDLEIGVGEFF